MSNNEIDRFDDIAKLLETNKVIQTLILTGNPITTHSSLEMMSQAMQQNLNIIDLRLDLDHSQINSMQLRKSIYSKKSEEENHEKFIERELVKNQFVKSLLQRKKWTF